MNDRDPENMIKGRIAEAIIFGLFESSNYNIYNFGYESLLQSLADMTKGGKLENNPTANKIRFMPDYILIDKNGYSQFIEVKFVKHFNNFNRYTIEKLKNIKEYWSETRLVVVTLDKPYFRTNFVNVIKSGSDLLPLDKGFPDIDKTIIEKFENYVESYLHLPNASMEEQMKESENGN